MMENNSSNNLATASETLEYQHQQMTYRYANQHSVHSSAYHSNYTNYDCHVDVTSHQPPPTGCASEYVLQETETVSNLSRSSSQPHWRLATKPNGYHTTTGADSYIQANSYATKSHGEQAQSNIGYDEDHANQLGYYPTQNDYGYANQLYEQPRSSTWSHNNSEASAYQYNSYGYYDSHHQQHQQENLQDKLPYYQQTLTSSNNYDTRYFPYPITSNQTDNQSVAEQINKTSDGADRGYFANGPTAAAAVAATTTNGKSSTWTRSSGSTLGPVYHEQATSFQDHDRCSTTKIQDQSWSSAQTENSSSSDQAHQLQQPHQQHCQRSGQNQRSRFKNIIAKRTETKTSAGVCVQNSAQRVNQCCVCGRNYARPSTLKTHLRTHTNERPFKCSVCYKTFSQAANLTAHQRVHTGERPFSCPICGRQFSQSSSVITHLRTHSGERPYRCSMCSRTFSDSSTLTKHCRIHSGEKPYQCDHCPLNFSQSGNLSRHLKLHSINSTGNSNNSSNSSSSSSSNSVAKQSPIYSGLG